MLLYKYIHIYIHRDNNNCSVQGASGMKKKYQSAMRFRMGSGLNATHATTRSVGGKHTTRRITKLIRGAT